MPSSTRKPRGAPTDDFPKTSIQRVPGASRNANEYDLDDSDLSSVPDEILEEETNKEVRRVKASKEAPIGGKVVKSGKKIVKEDAVNSGKAPVQTPRKSGKRTITKVEAAQAEEHIKVEEATPKKSRKRKAESQEEEAEQVDGEPTVKKTKGKRKTKEEKEAEAMPLVARSIGLRMFIGAHVSGAKGVHNAVTNCVHIGGNAFALFLKSQRKWENPPLQDEHRDGFRSNCVDHKYDATNHILPHGSYLVNLAQEDPDKAKQAYDSFLEDLQRCEALGIRLYNFHPGTTNNAPRPAAIARIASALNRAHSSTKTVTPLLETMAGSGNVLGSTFNDLASIISLVHDKSRIGICLDTCHLFAAGYDLRSPSSFAAVMHDLDSAVGFQYVKALHLNDSKAPFGSRRDLHANIGTGFLGLRAFWNVMNERRFEGLPMVLETPIDRKVDDDGKGPKKGKKEVVSDVDEEQNVDAEGEGKAKGKKKTTAKPPKEKTVEDKSIWAREIKLLENLTDMDVEGEEFKRLEKELADQGAEERNKHQDAFERKLAKEQKVKTKDIGSFFMKGKKKGKANGEVQQPVEDAESPLSELSDLSDDSEK
ncbi:MAG: hypothetical protein Q9213_003853 [Squamulea squamosa]